MIRFLLISCVLFIYSYSNAQLQDDFSDGNFTQNPIWVGNTSDFDINSQFQLHLNASGSDTSYLATANHLVKNTEWQFYVKQSFNSSSNNYSRVYLVANQSNLKANLNGYYVQIGSTQDNISLWRQDGATLSKIIDGTQATTANSVNKFNIKVLCDTAGHWSLFSNDANGSSYVLEGTATDNTYSSSSYFGVFCKYTSSNSTKFYFDNFYVRTIQRDTIAPRILNVKIKSANSLELQFDETVEKSSAENYQNYQINENIGHPISAFRQANDSSIVILTFNQNFTYAQHYLLSVENVKDLNNNSMQLTSYPFILYYLKTGDVVINEIMADPSPVVALPDAEYIELYNRSPLKVNLHNWTLKIGSVTRVLPEATILPDSFIIVAKQSNENVLAPYGNFVGLSSFSITNSGADILLRTDSNRLMHYISFKDSWYHNDAKKSGGWALEQIDPANYCGGISNWTASVSVLGGTPGYTNSVKRINPDTQPPSLQGVVVLDTVHIKLLWSETIDSTTALNLAQYTISNGLGSPLEVNSSFPDYKSFTLKLAAPLQKGKLYKITIHRGITDCAGNNISSEISKEFGLSQLADSNDVLVNEVLFNPRFNGVDYVELYNQSNKIIDLKTLRLANYNPETGFYENSKIITTEGFQLFPKTYCVLSSSTAKVEQQYYVPNPSQMVQLVSMPSLNNTSGNLFLLTYALQFIDGMNYDESMQYALLNNPEGVSLERISHKISGFVKDNWRSAATPGKNAEGFGGTPTYKNSQAEIGGISSAKWSVDPEIFSPNNDGIDDYLQIKYKLKQEDYTARIMIYNSRGQLVKTLANNELLGTQGQIIWDGLDDNNQKAAIGIYVIYIEMFNVKGNTEHFKLTAVLGEKF